MKENFEDIKQSMDVANDVFRVMSGQKSDSELNELAESDPQVMDLFRRFGDQQEMTNMSEELKKCGKFKNRALLESQLKRHNKFNWLQLVAVAVVLLMVGMVYYYDKNVDTTVAPSKLQAVNVPTIVYETGESVALIGEGAVIKNGEKIAYTSDSRIECKSDVTKVEKLKLTIPSASRYSIQLSDGSNVTLMSGSSLIYPSAFNDTIREVELVGEGFFSVSKSDIPFHVKSNGVTVEVYGTLFNINGYNSNKVTTTLLEGSVGVFYKNYSKRIVPGEQLTVLKDNNKIIRKEINIQKYKDWYNGTFRLDNDPLEELIEDLERWYNVEFEYDPQKISAIRITGSLDASLELGDVLKLVELSTDVKIKKEGGRYIIE